MDPKNLDPKLKEAYDRIMGMDLSTPQGSDSPLPSQQPQDSVTPPPPSGLSEHPVLDQAPPPPIPNPLASPPIQDVRSAGISNSFETQSQQTVRPEDQLPNIPPPPPPLNPVQSAAPTTPISSLPRRDVFQSFNAANEPAPSMAATPTSSPDSQAKPKPKISPVILVFVGLIFFAIYAVLWGKIFGVF